ncbi:MAG: ZIP family metal transporter [Bacilli bacterium]|nr:ZIP family metal transporter [Bacilli bacterium]
MEVIAVANFKSLLLTLLVGIFFLIGIIIPKFIKKKKELTLFATGLSFIVMLGMILFDIIPEIGELLVYYPNGQKWGIICGCTALGMLLLKGLDCLIPHHHHAHHEDEKNKEEHNDHLFHIGLVTSLSLMLHNLMEGISIYVTGITNFKLGLTMAFAVALHNIPLGMEIAVGLEANHKQNKLKWITITLLTLSSLIGSSLLYLFQINMSITVEACLLCTTFGMLIYITLLELLKEIYTYRQEKMIYVGIGLGILLNIFMVML